MHTCWLKVGGKRSKCVVLSWGLVMFVQHTVSCCSRREVHQSVSSSLLSGYYLLSSTGRSGNNYPGKGYPHTPLRTEESLRRLCRVTVVGWPTTPSKLRFFVFSFLWRTCKFISAMKMLSKWDSSKSLRRCQLNAKAVIPLELYHNFLSLIAVQRA